MKGKILHFDETTNRGKISGEDGKRYDFVRMDWKNQNTPVTNMDVDFEIAENSAKEIYPDSILAAKLANNIDGKDWLTTLLLAIFLGYLGIHRFYTGHTGIGIVQLLTGGGCGIWYIVDIIMIVTSSYKDSDGNDLVKKEL